MLEKLKGSAKAIVALLGSLLIGLLYVTDNFGGWLPDSVGHPLAIVIAVLTGILTWFAKYAPWTGAKPPAVEGATGV